MQYYVHNLLRANIVYSHIKHTSVCYSLYVHTLQNNMIQI